MATTNLKKNSNGYGYKYTDLAEIHTYLEGEGICYYQYIERLEGDDYIYTVPIIDGEEKPARRGCRVTEASLSGKSNKAQEQGSALTYARRYSLLMAFGLATTDDDAQLCASDENVMQAIDFIKKKSSNYQQNVLGNYGLKRLEDMTREQADNFIETVINRDKEKK